jgi:hypothetical protein
VIEQEPIPAGARVGGGGELGRHELDGHAGAELEMLREKDGSHAALRQGATEPVSAGDDAAFCESAHAPSATARRLADTPTITETACSS